MASLGESKVTEPVSAWATFTLQEYVDVAKSVTSIVREMSNILGEKIECFVPVQTHQIAAREVQVTLFEGYSFACHDGTKEFEAKARRARGTYIHGPLLNNGKLSFVSGKEISKYREKLKEMVYTYIPEAGDIIEGVDGTNMVGIVLSVDLKNKRADVRFQTQTREVLAKNLSFIALRLKEDLF